MDYKVILSMSFGVITLVTKSLFYKRLPLACSATIVKQTYFWQKFLMINTLVEDTCIKMLTHFFSVEGFQKCMKVHYVSMALTRYITTLFPLYISYCCL